MLTADGPNSSNSLGTAGMIRGGEAEGHLGPQPDQSAAELNTTGGPLLHAPFKELTDQHAAAQPGSTHRLTEHTRKTAAIGRRVHLQLPFGGHQM